MRSATPLVRQSHRLRYWFSCAAAILLGWGAAISTMAQAQENISIATLLKDGWQIVGYTAPGDNRSSFILFRHPDRMYLVNCRVGYDVNREPRSYSNCYELR